MPPIDETLKRKAPYESDTDDGSDAEVMSQGPQDEDDPSESSGEEKPAKKLKAIEAELEEHANGSEDELTVVKPCPYLALRKGDFKEDTDDDSFTDSDDEDDEEGSDSEAEDWGRDGKTEVEDDPEEPEEDVKEMTFDERKGEDLKALRKPFETSTVNAKSRKFPTRPVVSNDKFNGKKREKSYGPVTITLEDVPIIVNDKVEMRSRPVEVEGFVEPSSTTGRKGAPDPICGYQIYSGQKGQLPDSIPSERNQGVPDMERGHVMALELGGPDIPENIVPQWAKFQGSGEDWRQTNEKGAEKKAKELKKGQKLKYKVEVFYKDTGDVTPTYHSFAVPTGFRSTVTVIDENGDEVGEPEVLFDQAQSHDRTDQMLSERKAKKVDGMDWDPDLDKKKGEKD